MLRNVVAPRGTFVYQYDFGDGWDHAVLVEKVVENTGTQSPICVAGERACSPEDSGGPWDYAEKLEALASPTEDNEELRGWIGYDFDPGAFDMHFVNKELSRFFRPRQKKTPKTEH